MLENGETQRHGDGLKVVPNEPLGRLALNGQETMYSVFDTEGVIAKIRGIRQKSGFGTLIPIAETFGKEAARSLALSGYDRIVNPHPEDIHDEGTLEKLGSAFDGVWNRDPIMVQLPAAYTYFGQMLAHDLSRLSHPDPAKAAENLYDSVLDFDSIFPDPAEFAKLEPALMKLGLHVRHSVALGRTAAFHHVDTTINDLPRQNDGAPIVQDSRADSNLVLAQMNVAVLRHYLRLCDEFGDADQARKEVARRLHRITLYDYLPRILDPRVIQRILQDLPREIVAPGRGTPGGGFPLPIEFAGAIFRFGHSQVRRDYQWNDDLTNVSTRQLLDRTKVGGGLPEGRLPNEWVIDWKRLAALTHAKPDSAGTIDEIVARALVRLPQKFFDQENGEGKISVATRTLQRSRTLQLPSSLTLFDHTKHVIAGWRDVSHLSENEVIAVVSKNMREALLDDTAGIPIAHRVPLWFYTLMEAKAFHAGQRLGPLASLIVAETLHAAVEYSRFDDPSERRRGGTYDTLSAFLAYAEGYSAQ